MAKFNSADELNKIKALGTTIEYFDAKRQNGDGALGCRISPKDKRTWFLMYRENNSSVRLNLGTTSELNYPQARVKANAIMAGIAEGKFPERNKRKSSHVVGEIVTMSDLWDSYKEENTLHGKKRKKLYKNKAEKTQYDEGLQWNVISQKIGDMQIRKVTKHHIEAVTAHLVDAGKETYAKNIQALLSILFTYAMDMDFVAVNPVDKAGRIGTGLEPRERILEKDEIRAIWGDGVISDNMRDIYKLILLTLQRPGEVRAMEWQEIDLDEREWVIPKDKTKTRREHLIPLTDTVMEILRSRFPQDSGYVFPERRGAGCIGKTSLNRPSKNIQVESISSNKGDWTPHDLRRTGSSLLAGGVEELETDPSIIDVIQNHAVGKISITYQTSATYRKSKRIALEKWERWVKKVLGENVDGKIIQFQGVG